MSRIFDNDVLNYLAATLSTGITQPFTIFCWVKGVDWTATREGVLALGETFGNQNNSIELRTGNVADRAEALIRDTAGATFTANADSANEWDGVWIPMMLSCSSDTNFPILLKVDNKTQSGSPNKDLGTLDEIVVGQRMTNAIPLDGRVAHACVWDSELTAANFTSLATGGSGGGGVHPTTIDGTNLKAYYSFITTSLADESGNSGPTLTENGTVAWNADTPLVDTLSVNVTFTLKDLTGSTLRTNLSSLKWAWFDSMPADTGASVDEGTAETTDGSGEIILELVNTTLTTGQFGYLTLEDTSNNYFGGYRLAID